MSISVMTHVWKHSRHKGSELLTLLAIADFAHDDGMHAYPSIKSLSTKTRMTERNVQIVLKKLEESKELSIKRNAGPHGCHSFRINLAEVKSFQGEKGSGVKSFQGEDISPTKKGVKKQIVGNDMGEKFSGSENISGVKNSTGGVKPASPNPSLDPDLNTPPIVPPEGDEVGDGDGGATRPVPPSEPYTQLFRAFWKIYPKKRNIAKAWGAWKNGQCEAIAPTIMASVEAHKQDIQWKKDGGQFIPYPATFLNAKGWADELNSGRPVGYRRTQVYG